MFTGCGHDNIQKGEICLTLGDYRMAETFFKKELEKTPDSYKARLGYGKALIQKAVDGKGDEEAWSYGIIQLEASRTLNSSEEINSLLSGAYTAHARTLLNNQDTISALKNITRAVEYDTKNVEPLNLAGIIYFRMGETNKAEMLFSKSVSIDSLHPTGLFNLGMIHWQRKEYAESHKHWLKALKIIPEDEDVLYWFARAEKKLRELK